MEKERFELIEKGVRTALEAHRGVFRKGTKLPYLVHAMEACVIVASVTDDPEMITAALLHDTIEDGNVSYETIQENFGSRVANLVLADTHEVTVKAPYDPVKIWKETKQSSLDHLEHSERDAKIVALGDKLSNIRAMERDYLNMGMALFEKFSVNDPYLHKWYYYGLVKVMSDLSDLEPYKEFKKRVRSLFSKAAPSRYRKQEMSRKS